MATESGSVTLYPSSVDSSQCKYASVNTSYPLTNPIGKASSNTSYAQWNLTTGSRATSYVFYKFDCSSIPSEASITSVSCSAKAYINQTNSNRVATRQMQMYAGTSTAKGSATTVSNSATAQNLTCGSWNRTELDNCYIRLYAVRGTSSTTTTYYMRFYGATLTINYTYQGTDYTVTVDLQGNGTVDPEGPTALSHGDSYELTITPEDSGDTVKVTDNGVDVTSSLQRREGETGGEVSKNIRAYTTSGSITGTNYQSAVGKTLSDSVTSNNDYCSNSGSTAYISYTFDLSDIPSNAVIESVQCSVRGHAESTSNSSRKSDLQLYAGTTAKGSVTSFTSTSAQTVSLSDTGSWTRAEIDNLSLRFTIGYYGGTVGAAELTIVYSLLGGGVYYVYSISSVTADKSIVVVIKASGTGLFLRTGGSWVESDCIYEKRNGVWVVINASDIDTEKNYKLST